MRSQSFFASLLSFVSVATADLAAPRYPQTVGNWTGWGGNSYNNRWAVTNEFFNSETIANVVQHCQIQFQYGLSATPVISGDMTYFPTWSGQFVAVNYKTCDILWATNVTQIIADFGDINAEQLYSHQPLSRTSPQIDTENNVLYLGTQMFALLVALDLTDGTLLSSVQINDHIVAQISMSPTLYEGVVIVGASSEEEMIITYPGYTCCSFIGNVVAYKFDVASKTFNLVWDFKTIGDSSTQGMMTNMMRA
jgi:outer membrane protein assembly factor BamB